MYVKTTVKIGYILTSLLFLIYLAIPNNNFPKQLDNSLQSNEPADQETPLRRSYFTDYGRNEVLNFYKKQFEFGLFKWLPFTYKLNYPPEESQTLIRDQTRSSFLEEIVHPFRESLFVNGFQPKQDKDKIIVDGKVWNQKATLKLVQSNVWIRLVGGLLVIILIPILLSGWAFALDELSNQTKKIWNSR